MGVFLSSLSQSGCSSSRHHRQTVWSPLKQGSICFCASLFISEAALPQDPPCRVSGPLAPCLCLVPLGSLSSEASADTLGCQAQGGEDEGKNGVSKARKDMRSRDAAWFCIGHGFTVCLEETGWRVCIAPRAFESIARRSLALSVKELFYSACWIFCRVERRREHADNIFWN